MRLFTRIKKRYQRMVAAISEWFFGDFQYSYYDVPVYPDKDSLDETYVEKTRKKEYVDEPIKAGPIKGEDDVSILKMICVVCEECHEKDRAATECRKPLEKHAVSSTRMKCDVCGKESNKLVYCREYIKAFGKKSFMDQEIN